jgi:hypothetical protein
MAPMGAVLLKPGVDVQQTPSLNAAGINESQLLRFKNGLIQTYGGWVSYGPNIIGSTIRDLHAWQTVKEVDYLGIGATANLIALTPTSATDITPRTFTTNVTPNFSISSGSNTVQIVDQNSGGSIYDTVFFNTPVSIGNLLLNGPYPISGVLSTNTYQIQSSVVASTTIASSGILPVFASTANSPIITVTIPNNTFQSIVGLTQAFYAPTTVDGVSIQGPYLINTLISSISAFTITSSQQALTTASTTMNNGLVQFVYYVTAGPAGAGIPFGAGNFGAGTFGGIGGVFFPSGGLPITADDWSLDNWGEILIACPKNGPIYVWSPDSGFNNAQVVASAPFFNGGIFVSQPQQILVAWKSTLSTGVQDNLVVRWSDALDYTNWVASNQTAAGSFHIPTGSVLRGGLQAPNYGVVWTDIDVWLMMYVGGDVIFNFTRVGTGCGLVGQHAAGVIAGNVYWCGPNNFFTITATGTQSIPCTVWDFIFQNLNADNAHKIRCAPNSTFNEIGWFFPSTNSTENDSYVKFNIIENSWDYGQLVRTAWIDVSVLGNPIAADTGGLLYQHEVGEAMTGTGSPFFRSGWWSITEGNDLAFVDYIIPDFKFGLFSEPTDAHVNVTFFSADYPEDTPKAYGPYTITTATQYITPRIRGRLMAVMVQSQNPEFWRLGRIRFRYALSGRR